MTALDDVLARCPDCPIAEALRHEIAVERSNNRALVIHLEERAARIAALNDRIHRLEANRGRD